MYDIIFHVFTGYDKNDHSSMDRNGVGERGERKISKGHLFIIIIIIIF